MTRMDHDAGDDESIRDALHKIQAFLAVVLEERAGPLTSLQRDLLESARTTAALAELSLLGEDAIEQRADGGE